MAQLADCRVMVVEDQFYLARELQQMLVSAGATVIGPFPDEEEGFAGLKAERPDCAILDVNFGEGARYGLADQLMAEGVPFFFFTGYDDDVIPQRFSAIARLQKPLDTSRLINAAAAMVHGEGA